VGVQVEVVFEEGNHDEGRNGQCDMTIDVNDVTKLKSTGKCAKKRRSGVVAGDNEEAEEDDEEDDEGSAGGHLLLSWFVPGIEH
jgi:hypothetical protein